MQDEKPLDEEDENAVFALWRMEEDPKRKEELQGMLIKLLTKHGYAVCWQMLQEHRPDVVNGAIHRTLASAKDFRADSKFSTWYQAIVKHACMSVLRRKIKDRNTLAPEEEAEGIQASGDIEVSILLEELVRKAPVEDQKFVRLKFEGYSDEEIAKELGLEAKQIRKKWFHLKRRLRK